MFLETTPMTQASSRFHYFFLVSTFIVLIAASATLVSVPVIRGDEKQSPNPWTSAQTVQPADLAQGLEDKSGAAPDVVYVGFHTLFAGGHIPGAAVHGPASHGNGFAGLGKRAERVPRTANLVIYCV